MFSCSIYHLVTSFHSFQINERKTEEMSLREAIETVRRSNRLDLLVLKDDNLPPSYSTHSLPATFRHKAGGRERDMPNGYGDEQEPDLPARSVETIVKLHDPHCLWRHLGHIILGHVQLFAVHKKFL